MGSRFRIAVAAVVVAVLVLQLVAFQVRETEKAIVLTFGDATRPAIKEAGLYFKWPWPIEQVVRFDGRPRVLEAPLEECQTEDSKSLIVGSFAVWRVADPLALYKTEGSIEKAAEDLEKDLRDAQSKTIGAFAWSAIVNADPKKLRWKELEAQLKASLAERLEKYQGGIAIDLCGVRKLALPETTTERVFERMIAERLASAAAILGEGDAEAARIAAEAERERTLALDKARANARRALAEADGEAVKHHEVFKQDPEFAIFLRKLEAMKRVLASRSTFVFDLNTPPFDSLRGLAPVTSATQARPPK